MRKNLILTLLVSLGYSLPMGAQEGALSNDFILEVEESDDLGSIIEILSSRNQLHFAYAPSLLNTKPQITGLISCNGPDTLLAKLFSEEVHIDVRNENQILLRSKSGEGRGESSSQYLEFQIRDSKTGDPIPDVIVSMHEEIYQTLSDDHGKILLPEKIGSPNDKVHLSCIGFRDRDISWEEVMIGEIITLVAAPIEMKTIVVVAPLNKSPTAQQLIALDDVFPNLHSIVGAAGSDPLKAIQFLPGIKADDDLSSEIKIRGSDGGETLLILDGIPLHNTEHYYGIFSNINGNYIHDINLYKNVIPEQYGGKTGGLLEVKSPKQVDHFSGSLESNFIFSNLNLAIPIGKKWSFLVGGRASYFNAAKSQVFDFISSRGENYQGGRRGISRDQLIRSEPIYNFYDANAKLSFHPTQNTDLDLNFFLSEDRFDNNYSTEFLTAISDMERQTRELSNNSEDWSNIGTSLNLRHAFSDDWSLHANIYHSHFDDRTTVTSSLRQPQNQGISFSNNQENFLGETGGLAFLSKLTTIGDLKIGLSTKYIESKFHLSEDAEEVITSNRVAWESSGFASISSNKNPLKWKLGGRLNYYTPTSKFYFDPSLQASYDLNDKFRLKSSVGFNHQFVRELNYENRLTQSFDYFVLANDNNFPVGTAFNSMLGAQWSNKHWLVDVEMYRRNLTGVIEYALPTPGFNEGIGPSSSRNYGIYEGLGWVRGMDWLVNYQKGHLNSSFAYTLSSNSRQLDRVRGNRTYASEDDRRHQIKWTNVWSVGKFKVTANMVYSSGRPYLDLSLVGQAQNRKDFSRDQFQGRLPSYERLDLGLDYLFEISDLKMQIGVSCFNVLNRENVKYIQYIYAVGSGAPQSGTPSQSIVGTEAGLLPRTFNATLRMNF